ncbi:MAG: hypothetical protein ACK4ND_14425 [Cytophagaceae bacterium]
MKIKIIMLALALVFSCAVSEAKSSLASSAGISYGKPKKSKLLKKEERLNKKLFQINKEKVQLQRLKNRIARQETILNKKEVRVIRKLHRARVQQANMHRQ